MMHAGFQMLVPSRAAKTMRGAPRALASSSQTRAAAARRRAIFLSTALLSFALLSNLDKHAPNDRGGLWGQSWVIIPQTPLARLIKAGHLCLIPHLEQVAPAPAGSSTRSLCQIMTAAKGSRRHLSPLQLCDIFIST